MFHWHSQRVLEDEVNKTNKQTKGRSVYEHTKYHALAYIFNQINWNKFDIIFLWLISFLAESLYNIHLILCFSFFRCCSPSKQQQRKTEVNSPQISFPNIKTQKQNGWRNQEKIARRGIHSGFLQFLAWI